MSSRPHPESERPLHGTLQSFDLQDEVSRPRPDSPNAGWRNLSFRGYADNMQTSKFQTAVGQLVELSLDTRLCLMCAEAVPWRYHRRMISDALTVRGVPVEHALGMSCRQTHDLTPWAELMGEDGQLVHPPEISKPEQSNDEKPASICY